MGNLTSYCCKDENLSDLDETDDRNRILNPNYGNLGDDLREHSQHSNLSDQDNQSYGSLNNHTDHKTHEQEALDRIYETMTTNLIDTTAGESSIQHGESLERQKIYQAKFAQIKAPLSLRQARSKNVDSSANQNLSTSPLVPANPTTGLSSSQNPNTSKGQDRRRVDYDPISEEDVRMISDISKKTVEAVKKMSKVDFNEPIVTEFDP